jgi:hypothetical protein
VPYKDPAHKRAWRVTYRPQAAAQTRAWQAANRDKVLERRQRLRDFVATAKDGLCMDCGVKYPPYVMDFDHVRGEKRADVSKLTRGYSVDSIAAEIAKCDLVCSNCHRIRTYKRQQNAPS